MAAGNESRCEQSESLYRRSLALAEAAYGPDSPAVASLLTQLAEYLEAESRFEEAETLYRRSLSISEAAYGTDHPRVAKGLLDLAALLMSQSRYQEAEPLFRRSLTAAEAAYGPDSPAVAGVRDLLARCEEAEAPQRRGPVEIMATGLISVYVALQVLGIVGAIVGGVWLAVLGKWYTIVGGLLVAFLGLVVTGLAMLPGALLLGAPAAALESKGNRAGFYVFGLLFKVYSYAVLVAWPLGVMLYFSVRVADGGSIVPTLLWAYVPAIVPTAYASIRADQSGEESARVASTFTQIAYVVSILLTFTTTLGFLGVALVFTCIMLFGLVLQDAGPYFASSTMDREA